MCANEKKSLFQSLFKGMNIVKLQSQVQTSVLGLEVDFVLPLSQQQQEQEEEPPPKSMRRGCIMV